METQEIFEELAARRLITRFVEWLREQQENIGRVTYYRAIEQNGRTPTQRRALKLAKQFYEAEVQNKALVAEAV